MFYGKPMVLFPISELRNPTSKHTSRKPVRLHAFGIPLWNKKVDGLEWMLLGSW